MRPRSSKGSGCTQRFCGSCVKHLQRRGSICRSRLRMIASTTWIARPIRSAGSLGTTPCTPARPGWYSTSSAAVLVVLSLVFGNWTPSPAETQAGPPSSNIIRIYPYRARSHRCQFKLNVVRNCFGFKYQLLVRVPAAKMVARCVSGIACKEKEETPVL